MGGAGEERKEEQYRLIPQRSRRPSLFFSILQLESLQTEGQRDTPSSSSPSYTDGILRPRGVPHPIASVVSSLFRVLSQYGHLNGPVHAWPPRTGFLSAKGLHHGRRKREYARMEKTKRDVQLGSSTRIATSGEDSGDRQNSRPLFLIRGLNLLPARERK